MEMDFLLNLDMMFWWAVLSIVAIELKIQLFIIGKPSFYQNQNSDTTVSKILRHDPVYHDPLPNPDFDKTRIH